MLLTLVKGLPGVQKYSPVMNTQGNWPLGVFGTGLQKTWWWQKGLEVKTSHCSNHRGVSNPWCILHQHLFLLTNLGQLLGLFITRESITKANNSLNIQHPFYACPMGLGEVVWIKNQNLNLLQLKDKSRLQAEGSTLPDISSSNFKPNSKGPQGMKQRFYWKTKGKNPKKQSLLNQNKFLQLNQYDIQEFYIVNNLPRYFSLFLTVSQEPHIAVNFSQRSPLLLFNVIALQLL